MSIFNKQENTDDLLRLADSWNGYEREKAVKQLGLTGDSIAIPMLIKRANDWVPQVRNVACKALSNLLIEKNVLSFINALPTIYHLENCSRDDHRNLIKAIELFLLSEENKVKVLDGCKNVNPLIARCCLKLSIEHQLLPPEQIIRYCIENHDVIVRSTIANLYKLLTDNELKEFMESGLKDPFMPIRRETFLLCLSRFPDNSASLLKKFAFDRHASVREIAIKKLVEIGINVQNLYLQELQAKKNKPSQLRTILSGLSEINDTSSISTISEYLSSEYSSVRKTSLKALVRLDPEKAKQYLTVGLRDVSLSVIKESARLMKKVRIRLSESELMDLYSSNTSDVTKSCVLSLNGIRSKWDRITFLIWLANSPNSPEFIQRVEMEIRRWIFDYNRSFIAPTKYQTEVLNSRIRELPRYEDNEIFNWLRPYL